MSSCVKVEVRDSVITDADYIAANMRQQDIDELAASGTRTPLQVLRESITDSIMCWTTLVNDRPAFVWGVVPMCMISGVGSIWMLGTDDLKLVRKQFIKYTPAYLEHILAAFPLIYNEVDTRNTVAIRWLKWLGFTFGDIRENPHSGVPFQYFEMRRIEPCASQLH